MKRRRGVEADPQAKWKPAKLHRKCGYQIGVYTNHQLAQFLEDGLFHFEQPREEHKQTLARLWPRASFSPDMAAENIAAAHFWQRELNLNIDFFWDPSHRVNNDINAAIKSANKWDHIVLSLIRVNVPNSPWSQDTRYRQVRAARDEIFRNLNPNTCALFNAFLPQLLSEAPTARFATEPDPAQACWYGVEDENVIDNKNAKTVANRFCDVIRSLERDLSGKTQRVWFYLHTALEEGMLSNAAMSRIVARSQHLSTSSTNARIESVEDAAIRRANANQLVVALMDMLSADTPRTDKVIVSATKKWERWHGNQNECLRSVHKTGPWLQEQLDNKFIDTCFDTLDLMSTPSVLEFCDFIVPNRDQLANLCREEIEPVENMHAKDFAFLVISLDFHRLKNCAAMLIGWQNRSVFFQRRCPKAQAEIHDMRRDRQIFLMLEKKRHTIRGLDTFIEESPWNTLPMLQIYKVAEQDDFRQTSESCDWYTEQQKRAIGSQLVEDGFSDTKNTTTFANRRGTLEKAYDTLIKKNSIAEKHEYNAVKLPFARPNRDLQLDKSLYKPKYTQAPPRLKKICSTKQKTDWVSKKGDLWTQPFINMVVSEWLVKRHEIGLVGDCWLGGFICPTIEMIIRPTHNPEVSKWYLPLGYVTDSAVIMLPMHIHNIPGTNKKFFTLDRDACYRDLYQPVCDYTKWNAYRIEWKSPYSQALDHGDITRTFQGTTRFLGIRPITVAEEEPLLVAGVWRGFGNPSMQWLGRLAKHLALEVPGKSRLRYLEAFAKYLIHPPLTEAQLLDLLALPMYKHAPTEHAAISTFLDVEDAHQCFTYEDYENFSKAQESCKQGIAETKAYSAEWAAKRAAFMAKEAVDVGKGKGKAKAKAKALGKGGGPPPPHRELPPGDLTQPELKALVPRGGHIWIGHSSGTWNGHFAPSPRVSFSWHVYGHRGAAILTLRSLWKSYYTFFPENGSIDTCPIARLFEDDGLAALPSS